jgi:superfamily II DNA or RNA helicase
MQAFKVGSLVKCRGREWIVLPSYNEKILMLRPLGGSEAEVCGVYLPIEGKDVNDAVFPVPKPDEHGDFQAGQLLREATRFNLRNGSGPFRSFGQLNIRPRPYQLVPLILAIRLIERAMRSSQPEEQSMRLLIADDVGIGKTVEAGLIARELLDRGHIQRLVVLCPPHLCEQWQRELQQKFGIEAKVVRSSTISSLERQLPADTNLFEYFPFTITSIDYVKSERHRAGFIQHCPEFVIVDEAHTATENSQSNGQQRYQLLRALADRPERHLVLLTATPHSGINDAFLSLIGLLRKNFASFKLDQLSESQRRELARHFVQRRRADVQRWLGAQDYTPFPERVSAELSYELPRRSEYRQLYEEVYNYTRELISDTSGQAPRQRARYWAALALLRCVMSSPAAAERTFKNRATDLINEDELLNDSDSIFREQIYETAPEEGSQDIEPSQAIEQSGLPIERLQRLANRASKLKGAGDLKLQGLIKPLRKLIEDGYNPIIYCLYIATANYLAEQLNAEFAKRDLKVVAVTGERSEEEREQLIEELSQSPRRILVATDCMSEGINLQRSFDAVIHYDLPWNPNRLEQREGRVDRYGQPASQVRTIIYYGQNNPIDEAVLKVLLRKARAIHRQLGITVAVPVDSGSIVESVIEQVYHSAPEQLSLLDGMEDFDPSLSRQIELQWDEAVEREKISRTRFAQHSIKPDEVAKELDEIDSVLGDPRELEQFIRAACARMGANLVREGEHWLLPLEGNNLPPIVHERLKTIQAPSRAKTTSKAALRISFDPNQALPNTVELVGRNHPLTNAIADYLLEQALDSQGQHDLVARSGMIVSKQVERRHILLLVRVRLLVKHGRQSNASLAEEVLLIGQSGSGANHSLLGQEQALSLLSTAQASRNTSERERYLAIEQALKDYNQEALNDIAEQKAEQLRQTYARLSDTIGISSLVTIEPHLPPDLLGIYIIRPDISAA